MLQFASSICKWVAGVEQLLEAAGTLPSELRGNQSNKQEEVVSPSSQHPNKQHVFTQKLNI